MPNDDLKPQEIQSLTPKQRNLAFYSLALGAATASNSLYRQFLGNLKYQANAHNLGIVQNLAHHFKNPRLIYAGASHRFSLQISAVGIPLMAQDFFGVESRMIGPAWMNSLGLVFEVTGAAPKAQDVAAQKSGKTIDYGALTRSQKMLPLNYSQFCKMYGSIMIPFGARNTIYYLFALRQDPNKTVAEKAATGAAIGVITNPLDTFGNIVMQNAYEAKKGDGLRQIYGKACQDLVAGAKSESAYDKVIAVLRNSFRGAGLRAAGVAGASVIMSSACVSEIENAIESVYQGAHEFYEALQRKVDGAKSERESEAESLTQKSQSEENVEKIAPSSNPKNPKKPNQIQDKGSNTRR